MLPSDEEAGGVSNERKGLRGRIVSGAQWAIVASFTSAVLTIGENSLLARSLTAEQLGAYYLLFSVVSISATLGVLGLPPVAVRLVATALSNQSRGLDTLIQHIVRLVCVGLLVASLAGGAAVLFFKVGGEFTDGSLSQFVGIILWVFSVGLLRLYAELLRGFHDIRLASLFAKPVQSLFLVGYLCVGLFFLEEVTVVNVMWASALCSALALTLAAYAVRGKNKSQVPGQSDSCGTTYGGLLARSGPLVMNALVTQVLAQVVLWILSATDGDAAVAIYGVSVRLVALLALPLALVNSIVSPSIAELYSKQRTSDLQWMLGTTATAALLLVAPAFVVILVFPEFIIKIVFGVRYADTAANCARILAAGWLVSSIAGSSSLTLVMTGHEKARMWAGVAGGVTTMIVGMVLIPFWGPEGAAWATSSGLISLNLGTWYLSLRQVGVATNATFVGPQKIVQTVREVLKERRRKNK